MKDSLIFNTNTDIDMNTITNLNGLNLIEDAQFFSPPFFPKHLFATKNCQTASPFNFHTNHRK